MITERIVVTGVAGFVGGHVARALLDDGYGVVGLDSFDPFYPREVKEAGLAALSGRPGFTFHEADVRRVPSLTALLRGADAVIHLAARPGVRSSLHDPEVYRDLNEVGTARLLEACGAVGLRRIVFASSSSVYGRHAAVPFREDVPLGEATSPYAATKQVGESLIRSYAQSSHGRAAILRLFSVYGPRQRPDLAMSAFTSRLRTDRPVCVLGDGSSRRDYTHVSDVARGILLALAWTRGPGAASEVFNLGTGHPVRLDWVVAQVARCLGVTPRWDRQPAHPADLPVTWADIGKARATLRFEPRVPLHAGIVDYVEWHEREHGRQPCTTA